MMNINDDNYELWLLRYAEQELTESERTEVEQWLECHPQAAEELALYNEAPRLERNNDVRYVAAPRQHTLWGVTLRWAAAAAVVLALMLPGLRTTTSPAPRMVASAETPSLPEMPEVREIQEEQHQPVATPKAITQPHTRNEVAHYVPESQEEPELPEPIDQPESQNNQDTPAPLYVDDLIVYEDEPAPAEPQASINEVTYVTLPNDDINPVTFFIGTFIKTTR